MKKICFVLPVFPAVSETFITNQIIQLKQKGYDVVILTHKLQSIEESSQKELILKYDLLKKVIEVDYEIPISKLSRLIKGLLPIVRYLKSWVKTPNISFRHRFINLPYLLKFYGKLRHIDVFHIQFAVGSRGIAEMTENGLLNAKVVTTFHGYDAHYSNENQLNSLKARYKTLFDISDFITVNTGYLVPKVIALGCDKQKIKTIPMGIDVNYFKSTDVKQLPLNDVVHLISIGRLKALKGFEFAIKAVKLLIDQEVKVNYTIVGVGNLYNRLQALITQLGLDNEIQLVGKKSQDELKTLLKTHHIYLMSSITNAKGQSEAQGLVTAEAQALGLPVVAFNSGGLSETILNNETGFLVPEKNIEAYANAILKLINDPDRYQEMSNLARDFVVEKFSNELMTSRFIKLYNAN
ncbi:glycosyltransferase [Psychroserpens sp. MEBiC05023]